MVVVGGVWWRWVHLGCVVACGGLVPFGAAGRVGAVWWRVDVGGAVWFLVLFGAVWCCGAGWFPVTVCGLVVLRGALVAPRADCYCMFLFVSACLYLALLSFPLLCLPILLRRT